MWAQHNRSGGKSSLSICRGIGIDAKPRGDGFQIGRIKRWIRAVFMSVTLVQIRNLPPELRRRLKARAAMEGLSMSDFILREIRKAPARPTRQEVLARLRPHTELQLRRSPA